jgi:hypothetical protein
MKIGQRLLSPIAWLVNQGRLQRRPTQLPEETTQEMLTATTINSATNEMGETIRMVGATKMADVIKMAGPTEMKGAVDLVAADQDLVAVAGQDKVAAGQDKVAVAGQDKVDLGGE